MNEDWRDDHRNKGDVVASYDELDQSISRMDPFTVAEGDYIDEETGEVYLDKGKPAVSSRLHPQHQSHGSTAGMHSSEFDDAEFDDVDSTASADDELTRIITEFAKESSGLSNELEVDPSDAASDIAENFFHKYPEWASLARSVGLSKREIKERVADYVYEEMLSVTGEPDTRNYSRYRE